MDMPKPIGAKYGSFKPEELDKLPRYGGLVKFIIDTNTGIAYYVINPGGVNHVDAVVEYISNSIGKRLTRNDLTTENAGHMVGAVIEVSSLRYIIGHSSVETEVEHTRKQQGEAEAVVIKIRDRFKLCIAAKRAA